MLSGAQKWRICSEWNCSQFCRLAHIFMSQKSIVLTGVLVRILAPALRRTSKKAAWPYSEVIMRAVWPFYQKEGNGEEGGDDIIYNCINKQMTKNIDLNIFRLAWPYIMLTWSFISMFAPAWRRTSAVAAWPWTEAHISAVWSYCVKDKIERSRRDHWRDESACPENADSQFINEK